MITRRPARRSAPVVATLLLLAACGGGDAHEESALPTIDPQLGGATSRDADTRNAFGLPAPNLSSEDGRAFEVGDSFFTQNWVTAPASTSARDGLGPTMNAQSCSSCHLRDGRGAPPEGPADGRTLGLLLRLSVPGDASDGGPVPEPTYGGQLQDRAIDGVASEGRMQIEWQTEAGAYDDGTDYELRWPEVVIADLAYGPLADDVLVSPRLAPQVIGVGLLEAVPEDVLRDLADPDDEDGDGISGRANVVVDPRTGERAVGRFGWKANVATVEAQVAGAFHGDIGITSTLADEQNCGPNQAACDDAVDGGNGDDVEIGDDLLGRVVFYNQVLAVPTMRGSDRRDVRAGAAVFESVGCASCHRPTLQTGDAVHPALADQTIHPYTDLLLHDMGDGLADGRPDHLASGSEWRTPPLWGLGLIETVSGPRFLLHDGRARTIEEAILWHGGEGEASKLAFRALDAAERDDLVTFLEAL
ncbi:MAG: thiol oxidoreductase [Acidimicrobiales bacterium]|nr:thiol oxidoreductase [Acidimicrobiales bacterium]